MHGPSVVGQAMNPKHVFSSDAAHGAISLAQKLVEKKLLPRAKSGSNDYKYTPYWGDLLTIGTIRAIFTALPVVCMISMV